jgi:Tfp pilus assembly protein PilO
LKSSLDLKAHRLAIAALAVALVAGAAGYWRSMGQSDLQTRLENLQSQANRQSDNIRFSQKLDAQYAHLVEINEHLNARLTTATDLASNQQYFYRIEKESGVKLLDLRQTTLPRKKRASGIFTPVPYTISVQGEYSRILKFIRELESGERLCRVVSFALSNSSGGTGTPARDVSLTFTIDAELIGIQ